MNTSTTKRWVVLSALALSACDLESQAAKDKKTQVSDLDAADSRDLCQEIVDVSVDQVLGDAFAHCTLQGLSAERLGAGSCESLRSSCLQGANERVISQLTSSSCQLDRCEGLTVAEVRKCNDAYREQSELGVAFTCKSSREEIEAFLDADPPEACQPYFDKCGF